jgi:hypothetical protein
MTNGQWSEKISIECPFEKTTHNYTLKYLSKDQGTVFIPLEYKVKARGDEPKQKDVEITRTFKCPATGRLFKAEIELSIPSSMNKDNISVK